MIREHFQYKTTITTILADEQSHIEAAKDAMFKARLELEELIILDPYFGSTLEPYHTDFGSITAKRMSDAAEQAGVGPMAAVAGTIAWQGVEAMQDAGAEFALVDNGGDIALISNRDVRIGLHAGSFALSDRIAFIVPPQQEILGVCTSSATVGPSISFGIADAVTVFSANVALADAWATSLCNSATECFSELFAPLKGSPVDGVFISIGNEVCTWGEIPEIVAAKVDENLITAGRQFR
ncbi:MAG: UPF0280 family protein [Methanogenium sp.]|nr:UPF0280 family protein [Methanogenium sp.]